MYRSRLWTVRMFAGFGTAVDTNRRFHDLLASGSDGLSTAFDLPTLMGRDSDDALALGEVGKCGVAVDTLADVEDLYRGIDLGAVTTSMTINGPAAVIFAMFIANAEANGVERGRLGGTLQNDILKEYQAQKEFIFPPRPSMRLVRDTIAFCAAELPRWHPISISGYHIREAGSTAAQELAFTVANGFAYVELGLRAGLAVDAFAPRLSFFFNAHIEIFAEIEQMGDGSMLDGAIRGCEEGWYQGEIADSAYELERKLNAGRDVVVGVNAFPEGNDEPPPPTLRIGPEVEDEQRRRLEKVKHERNGEVVERALPRVRTEAADADANLMSALLEAAGAYATLRETDDALAAVLARRGGVCAD